MNQRKRVYVAYTGGTIGMRRSDEGQAPAPGYLAQVMATLPELREAEVPLYTLHEYESLLDSANMTPADWLRIGQDIVAHYGDYDGFVVLHGTDTMSYTAAALSFLLEDLGKPVVLTGSQIPLAAVRSDARDNLLTSLLIAGSFPIPEVCLYFNNQLLRGNRTRKVSAGALDAFPIANYLPLGTAGVDLEIHWQRILPSPPAGSQCHLQEVGNPHIGAIRLFPGITGEIVSNFLRDPIRGLVLETYGAGNGPVRNPGFLEAIREATARGVVIVNCTQCHFGTVAIDEYATGRGLARAGVISGYDLTPEAALTKLYYLFGKGLTPGEVKEQMQKSLRGEMTLPA